MVLIMKRLLTTSLFQKGRIPLTVAINAIVDNLDEGLESIGIDIQRDICNRDTFWMFIRDNEIVPPELGPDLTICQGDSVALDGNLPLPLPVPPSFTNDQNYHVDSYRTYLFANTSGGGTACYTRAGRDFSLSV